MRPRRAPGRPPLTLRFQGFSHALQQHATVVQFAIENPPPNLSIGLPVNVIAKSGEPVTAMIVPKDAVVRSANGEAIVWLHEEAELFEPRPVRVAPFDAARVIIAAGVSKGDRVVVRAVRSREPGALGERDHVQHPGLGEPAQPAVRPGGGADPRRLRRLRAAAHPGRRVSRPEPPDGHAADRGRRPGAAGGRAARHLSDRDLDERHAGRDPGALGVRRRPVRRLCGIRLGHRHLSRAAARVRAAGADPRAASARPQSADGPGHLDHGRDHAGGADHRRPRLADGGARDRRFHRASAASGARRRRPGDPDRRRSAPVPGDAERRHHAGARRHARADRAGDHALRHQHRRRLRRPERPRIPHPQCRPDQAARGPRQHGRGLPQQPADPAQAGGDRRVRGARQARRRRLSGRARRHHRRPEAAERRHRRADPQDRGRARTRFRRRCRPASRPPTSSSGRRPSSRRRSATSSACWSRPRSWSPSCCSCS